MIILLKHKLILIFNNIVQIVKCFTHFTDIYRRMKLFKLYEGLFKPWI
jgi:hypothetical protein